MIFRNKKHKQLLDRIANIEAEVLLLRKNIEDLRAAIDTNNKLIMDNMQQTLQTFKEIRTFVEKLLHSSMEFSTKIEKQTNINTHNIHVLVKQFKKEKNG